MADYEERRYTSQDGLALYFRDYGPRDGQLTPVLCLPGLTRNSNDFRRVAKLLGHERRVICPDYRGRGASPPDPDWRNYQPPTYVNDVRHLLTALNLHRVFVIGTSMGGLLAMGMGAAMPSVLAGALINYVGPVIETDGLDKILAYMQDGKDGFDDWDAAAAYLRTKFPEIPAETDADWLRVAQGTYQQGADGRIEHNWDYDLIKPLLANREIEDLWPLFRTLKRIPLVVVRGALSDILSAETFAQMGEACPNTVPVTVDGVGHMPTLLETQCQEALAHALAECDPDFHAPRH
ncbi:MAG: alpha/beta hydrolase [Rhodospirillaceae bacterium]